MATSGNRIEVNRTTTKFNRGRAENVERPTKATTGETLQGRGAGGERDNPEW